MPFEINNRTRFLRRAGVQIEGVPVLTLDLVVRGRAVSSLLPVVHKGFATVARLGIDVRNLGYRLVDANLALIGHKSGDQFSEIGSRLATLLWCV